MTSIFKLSVFALAAFCASLASANPVWKSFRNGPTNSGLSEVKFYDTSRSSNNDRATSFSTSGLIWGTAIIDEQDTVYVGSADKKFYAIGNDGVLKWSYTLFDRADSLIDSAAVFAPNNLVVIPGGDGFLHAVDRTTGQRRWIFQADGVSEEDHQQGATVNSFEGNVQLGSDGNLYAGSDNGYLYSLDLNGKLRWKFATGMMIWSSPAFFSDWMVFGSLDRNVYLLNPKNGQLIDELKTKGDVKASPAVDSQGRIYVGASDGVFRAMDVVQKNNKRKLKLAWKFKTQGEIYSSAAISGDRIVVGSHDGRVYCLSREGQLLWSFETFETISASPLITADGVVVVGNRTGVMLAIDLQTGLRVFSLRTSPSIQQVNLDASPALTSNGKIINGSYSGLVHSIPIQYALKNGKTEPLRQDAPDLGTVLPEEGAALRLVSREGFLSPSAETNQSATEILKWKLIAFGRDGYQPNTALISRTVKIHVTPQVPFRYWVASDGSGINLILGKMPSSVKRLEFQIQGATYFRKSWPFDRFSRVTAPHLYTRAVVNLKTSAPSIDSSKNSLLKRLQVGPMQFGVKGMYMSQPRALDTYIPAALAGQGFHVLTFLGRPDSQHPIVVGLPAFPKPEGVEIMPEPSKAFVLKTDILADGIQLRGKFTIAAMGGEIPFEEILLRAKFDAANDRLIDGELLADANCMKLKGNGQSYSFPLQLIDLVCDHRLHMIGVGRFDAVPTQLPVSVVPGMDTKSNIGATTMVGLIAYDTVQDSVIPELSRFAVGQIPTIPMAERSKATVGGSIEYFTVTY